MTTAHDLATSWWELAGRGLIEGSLALAVLLALWWPLRRRFPARFAYLLFLLPLVKVTVPVALPAPAWLSPLVIAGWWNGAAAPATSSPIALEVAGPLPMILVADDDAPLAAAPRPTLTAREMLFVTWVLGVLLLTARFGRAQVRTHGAVRAAVPVDPATLPLDLHALRLRAGVFRRVRWLVSDRVATPAAGGVLFPYILLPAGFAASLPPRQLAFVLLHELAHVRRGDVAVVLVQRAVQILWFFHPAVWLASWLIDQQRELACDQDALARSGASRRECGAAFLSVAAWMQGRATEPTATLAMFDEKCVLRRRLVQILTDVPAPSRLLTVAYLALASAITLPSAKADDGLGFDTELLAPQDDGQREEIERLRRQIADLKKQQAELSKQLAKMRSAEEKGEAKDEAKSGKAKLKRAADSEHTGLVEVEVEGDGEPRVRTYKARTGGTAAQAFVLEDGELRELKVEDVEGGLRVYVGGDGKAHAVGVDGKEVKALRTGDGEAFTFVLPEMRVHLPEGAQKPLKTKLPRVLKVDGKNLFEHEGGKWVLRTGEGEDGLFKVIEGGDGEGGLLKVIHGDVDFHFEVDGAQPEKAKRKAKALRPVERGESEVEGEGEGKKAKKGDADGEKVEVKVESPKAELRRATRTVHV